MTARVSDSLSVLIVDDDRQKRMKYVDLISNGISGTQPRTSIGPEPLFAQIIQSDSAEGALSIINRARIEERTLDLLIVDLVMPGLAGTWLLEQVLASEHASDYDVILLSESSAALEYEEVIESIKNRWLACGKGFDVVLRGSQVDQDPSTHYDVFARMVWKKVWTALDSREVTQSSNSTPTQFVNDWGRDFTTTDATLVRQLEAFMKSAVGQPLPILLTGEPGTGKSRLARLVHTHSARHASKFVEINMAAIPPGLEDSALFGHKRGSFTGANDDRVGYFEEASGGTIFLDEIAEATHAVQAKILMAVNDLVIRPVGGNNDVRIDVRVIAATNIDVTNDAVRRGKFRDDLYYRLNVICLRLPSLAERKGDVGALAVALWKSITNRVIPLRTEPWEATALEIIAASTWPGNIRQLENYISVLKGSVALSSPVSPAHLRGLSGFKTKDELDLLDTRHQKSDHLLFVEFLREAKNTGRSKTTANQHIVSSIIGTGSMVWGSEAEKAIRQALEHHRDKCPTCKHYYDGLKATDEDGASH